jgi:hypothetical protein
MNITGSSLNFAFEHLLIYLRFQALTVVSMKITALWGMLCILVEAERSEVHTAITRAMMMEAVHTSVMSSYF